MSLRTRLAAPIPCLAVGRPDQGLFALLNDRPPFPHRILSTPNLCNSVVISNKSIFSARRGSRSLLRAVDPSPVSRTTTALRPVQVLRRSRPPQYCKLSSSPVHASQRVPGCRRGHSCSLPWFPWAVDHSARYTPLIRCLAFHSAQTENDHATARCLSIDVIAVFAATTAIPSSRAALAS